MQLIKIKFLLFILIIVSTATFANCEKLQNSCEYYTCINIKKNCNNKSYFKRFGLKYCLKFEKKIKKFSPQGQEWIQSVKSCLISSIEEADQQLTCKEYKNVAIKHHTPCYFESGYCNLSFRDKRQVIQVIKFSLWKPSIIKTAIQILNKCHNTK